MLLDWCNDTLNYWCCTTATFKHRKTKKMHKGFGVFFVFDWLTLVKVGEAPMSAPEFLRGLWGRLSSWHPLSRTSDRFIGRTRGGGPKCKFCCWSFSYDSSEAKVWEGLYHFSVKLQEILPAELWFCCEHFPGIKSWRAQHPSEPDQLKKCCRGTKLAIPSCPGSNCWSRRKSVNPSR